MAKSKSSGGGGKAVIVVLVVIIAAFFIYYLATHANNSGPSIPGVPGSGVSGSSNPLSAPTSVSLSGTATASGQGTSISGVTFINKGGGTYSATVSSGSYSVILPNPGSYTISETWSGQYPWQTGTVQNVGTYQVSQGIGGSTQLSYDLPQLTTLNSQVQLSGAVKTGFSTTAVYVYFTATNGQGFELTVSSGNTYQGEVGNLMVYKVQIFYKNAYGSIQNCTAQTAYNVTTSASSGTANWQC